MSFLGSTVHHTSTVFLLILIFPVLFCDTDSFEGTNSPRIKNPPWAEKHLPPPPPALPPLPPSTQNHFKARSHFATSVCSLPICMCTAQKQGNETVVDVACVCNKTYRIFTMGEPMLPPNADTLSISDCAQVHLTGSSPGDDGWKSGGNDFLLIPSDENLLEEGVTTEETPLDPILSRPLSSLSIFRTSQLSLLSQAVGPVLDVRFEDIRKIVALPSHAFQPPQSYTSYNETEGKWKMHTVTFRNVSEIERVNENAISDVDLSSFLWVDVHVVIMEDNAVHVRIPTKVADVGSPCDVADVEGSSTPCEDPRSSFFLAGSVIGAMGLKSIDVSGGHHVSFDSCHISRIGPSSISIHGAMKFSFTRNYVFRSIAMFGFDVVAKDVEMSRNRFARLEENALVGIRPIESEEHGEPSLKFEENLLEEVDLMSLNVGWKIFTEFSSRREFPNVKGFSFEGNSFVDCSCPHLGWIVQVAVADDDFFSSYYALILHKESGNYCAKEPLNPMGLHLPCRLPLSGLVDLFEDDGKTCKRTVDVEEMCAKFSIEEPMVSKASNSVRNFAVVMELCVLFGASAM